MLITVLTLLAFVLIVDLIRGVMLVSKLISERNAIKREAKMHEKFLEGLRKNLEEAETTDGVCDNTERACEEDEQDDDDEVKGYYIEITDENREELVKGMRDLGITTFFGNDLENDKYEYAFATSSSGIKFMKAGFIYRRQAEEYEFKIDSVEDRLNLFRDSQDKKEYDEAVENAVSEVDCYSIDEEKVKDFVEEGNVAIFKEGQNQITLYRGDEIESSGNLVLSSCAKMIAEIYKLQNDELDKEKAGKYLLHNIWRPLRKDIMSKIFE